MALATSGTMSIGGTTATRSINLELGRAATATSNMGETDLRTLAGVSSGAISMSNFYGKSSAEIQNVTVGTLTTGGYVPITSYGYASGGYGSISDGTFGPSGGDVIDSIAWSNIPGMTFRIVGSTNPNSGWSNMVIGSQTFSRSAATFSQDATNNFTTWQWFSPEATSVSPFGTTVGAVVPVTFT